MNQRDELTGHVFISYVHENSSEVDQLQRTLESNGIPVWRDKAQLWPGEDWASKIRDAIKRDALVFIACFSNEGLARKVSYQNEELNIAIQQLRMRRPDEPWLIPVRFDDCHIPEIDIGSGRTLDSIQRSDLFGRRLDEESRRLVGAVLRILGWPPRQWISAIHAESSIGDRPVAISGRKTEVYLVEGDGETVMEPQDITISLLSSPIDLPSIVAKLREHMVARLEESRPVIDGTVAPWNSPRYGDVGRISHFENSGT